MTSVPATSRAPLNRVRCRPPRKSPIARGSNPNRHRTSDRRRGQRPEDLFEREPYSEQTAVAAERPVEFQPDRQARVGEFRSNLAQGGYAERADLTPIEEEICAAMGPELKKRGLIFVGIDVIGGKWLTEINVTSPTGIVSIDQFNGTDTAARIWDAIEARLVAN